MREAEGEEYKEGERGVARKTIVASKKIFLRTLKI